MSIGGRIFAAIYDRFMDSTEKAGLADQRRSLLEDARGDLLEVGAGTGANLPLYGDSVSSVTLVEPEEPMLKRLRRRVLDVYPKATVLQAPAENLPFPDASFDTVVSTLVLCSVADQPKAIQELRRVLRPDGQLLFIEHVRGAEPKLARRQDRLNGLNRKLLAGCNCNRETLEALQRGGFDVSRVEHGELPKAPSFVRPTVYGAAVPG